MSDNRQTKQTSSAIIWPANVQRKGLSHAGKFPVGKCLAGKLCRRESFPFEQGKISRREIAEREIYPPGNFLNGKFSRRERENFPREKCLPAAGKTFLAGKTDFEGNFPHIPREIPSLQRENRQSGKFISPVFA